MRQTTIHSRDDETIVALCTPRGTGSLALIRLSGVNARAIATVISKFAGNKKLEDFQTHTVHLGWVVDEERRSIDQVMFTVMIAPHTFTGQDIVEITAHNNQFLIEAIIGETIKQGARLADGGEFSKRAFMNGKIDLIQAEAINELIHAQTHNALKKSLAQLEGSFSSWIAYMEKELISTLAWSEASFEFLEEEEEFGEQIKERIHAVLDKVILLKKNFNIQQQLRPGIRIALIGSVNAGKSSIFNALLGHKRSIVTSIAGTTRDSIEAGMYRNNNFWTLIDTAGLRKTDDIIEQEGIRRAHEEAHKADIIILVIDGSCNLSPEECVIYNQFIETYNTKIICVKNKIDLPQYPIDFNSTLQPIEISSYNASRCSLSIEQAIEEKVHQLFTLIESPFLLNERQYNLLLGLERQLMRLRSLFQEPIAYELISYHLRDAIEHISELTGKSVSEAGMDAVFKEFCVGK